MRLKDAVVVGKVLGREARAAAPGEEAGIEACIGAIRGHLAHVHPEIDLDTYDRAVADGMAGRF